MALQQLFTTYQQELAYFFSKVQMKQVQQALDVFLSCEGFILFSGAGKSGLAAQKTAVTMTSTGTRALFLSPLEAVHGDMGLVGPKDWVVLVSKSGETEELLHLIPYVRNKGAKLMAWVSNAHSRMAQAVDLIVELPIHKELCPFNMAPTTSTAAQLILGDVLSIALMQARGFTLDAYAMNHPAGSIGKRITLKVRDIMLSGERLPLCGPQETLGPLLVELSDKRSGCLLVVDDKGVLLGIFTDGDLRRALQKWGAEALEKPMELLMTSQGRTVEPQELAWEAMKRMEDMRSPITVMPVVDSSRKVLGLLRMHDILQVGF